MAGSIRERQALAALALTTLFWATTFVVVRDLVSAERADAVPPLTLVALRFAAASLGVLAVAVAGRSRPTGSTWGRGAILGLLTAGGFGFQTLGLRFTTSARSAFITNVSLLLVPLFGLALGRRWPSRGWWLGAGLALVGLWFLEFPWDAADAGTPPAVLEGHLWGDLLTLGCATFFALQILATESLSPREPLLWLVFVQLATCAAAALAAAAGFGELRQPIDFGALRVRDAIEIVYLSLVATAFCLLVQAWAQRHTTSARAAIVFMLEPVLAAVLGTAILGEALTLVQWAAAGVVVAGVLAAELLGGAKPAVRQA